MTDLILMPFIHGQFIGYLPWGGFYVGMSPEESVGKAMQQDGVFRRGNSALLWRKNEKQKKRTGMDVFSLMRCEKIM